MICPTNSVKNNFVFSDSLLSAEAAYLYFALFSTPISEKIVRAYVSVHKELVSMNTFPIEELETVRKVVYRGINPCFVEFWLRKPSRRHALHVKLLLLAYLEEVEVAQCDTLSGCKFHTYFLLLKYFFAGVASLLFGLLLKRWHGLL